MSASGMLLSAGTKAPRRGRPVVAIVGNPTRTSDAMALAWRALGVDAVVLEPRRALGTLAPGDVALVRLDVLPTLDGVEAGLDAVEELLRRGVRVLNHPAALLDMHDKLRTALVLHAAGVPHPRTVAVGATAAATALPMPGVVKPRYGSWGRDVIRYADEGELEAALDAARATPWWEGAGGIAQAYVDAAPNDLRVVVAGGRVVGSASRSPRGSEWRTNLALGGTLVHAAADPEAETVARAAVRAVGADLAGVDLLVGPDGWVVLELNGAVDFDLRYQRPGTHVFGDIARALALPAGDVPANREEVVMPLTMEGEPAGVGDVIEITGHAVGDAPRLAEIVEVLGEADHEHYRVRWEDGHESIFFPGSDAHVLRRAAKRPPKAARR